jgi:hypothetical protein
LGLHADRGDLVDEGQFATAAGIAELRDDLDGAAVKLFGFVRADAGRR